MGFPGLGKIKKAFAGGSYNPTKGAQMPRQVGPTQRLVPPGMATQAPQVGFRDDLVASKLPTPPRTKISPKKPPTTRSAPPKRIRPYVSPLAQSYEERGNQ
jgi:hypothetical protein